jgi:hypothetical protein
MKVLDKLTHINRQLLLRPHQFVIEFVGFSKLKNEARGRNEFTNIIFQFGVEIMRRANKHDENIYI